MVPEAIGRQALPARDAAGTTTRQLLPATVRAKAGLRVLVVNSLLDGGGVDSHTLALCQALQQQGCDVTLAAPHGARWLPLARALPGVRVLALRVRRQLWPAVLGWHMREHGVQVIHAHHGRDYWIAILARLLAGVRVPVVVTRHLMTRLKVRTYHYLSRFATVVAVSDAVADVLRADDPARRLRLRRIHCGIDTERFRADAALRVQMRARLGLPEDGCTFMMVGALIPPGGKGQREYLHAAARLAARHPHARFLCVGEGALAQPLREEAARLGLADRFRLLPFDNDVASLLQAADVLVHPAVCTEALGLVLLEAQSCGKPVIGSLLDGIPETFVDGEHGLLVPPRDVAALADAMDRLAADRALAAAMGRRGAHWVRSHFSLARLGEDTVRLYRECLRGAMLR